MSQKQQPSFKKRGARYKVSAKSERTVDDIVFDSKWESKCYVRLKDRIPEGELHLQPKFIILEKFRGPDDKMVRAVTYSADFLLGPPRVNDDDELDPLNVVIDAKGHQTDVFKLKTKFWVSRYQARLWVPKNLTQLEEAISYYEQLKQ